MAAERKNAQTQRLRSKSACQTPGTHLAHGEQGQRGIDEAQTCAQSENHEADQDDFDLAEQSKERIFGGFCFYARRHIKQSESEENDKNH